MNSLVVILLVLVSQVTLAGNDRWRVIKQITADGDTVDTSFTITPEHGTYIHAWQALSGVEYLIGTYQNQKPKGTWTHIRPDGSYGRGKYTSAHSSYTLGGPRIYFYYLGWKTGTWRWYTAHGDFLSKHVKRTVLGPLGMTEVNREFNQEKHAVYRKRERAWRIPREIERTYYDNGQLKSRVVESGSWAEVKREHHYSESGTLVKKVVYNDRKSKRIKKATWYHPNGKLWKVEEYYLVQRTAPFGTSSYHVSFDLEKNGEWVEYGEDGTLQVSATYDGVKPDYKVK